VYKESSRAFCDKIPRVLKDVECGDYVKERVMKQASKKEKRQWFKRIKVMQSQQERPQDSVSFTTVASFRSSFRNSFSETSLELNPCIIEHKIEKVFDLFKL
jgi:hypothetical protein